MNSVSQIGAALSDEKRVRLMVLLENCSLCVKCLTKAMNQVQPTVSRNLGVLRNTGLVKWRREGVSKYYSLDYGGENGPLKRRVIKAYCGGIKGMEPYKSDIERLMKISLDCDADCTVGKKPDR